MSKDNISKTLQEICNTDRPMLNAIEVGIVLGVNPQSIRAQARNHSESLGFPVIVLGSRTLIPRKPFLKFIGEKEENAND